MRGRARTEWDNARDGEADRVRWEWEWLAGHRLRTTGDAPRSAARPSATATTGFRDGSARPSPDAGAFACGGSGLEPSAPDADARMCSSSIFDAYYPQLISGVRPAEHGELSPSGHPPPDRKALPVAGPSRAGALPAASEDEVSIPDAGLRAAVIARLRKAKDDPITEADMAGIASLSAAGRGIADLSGLRHATGLLRLDLSRNHISDLSELAALTKLTHLYLEENFVHDLGPLRNLGKLRSLAAAENWIWDLTPLSGLTDLRVLDLGSNDDCQRPCAHRA